MCFWVILAKPQNVLYVTKGGSISVTFFLKEFWCVWSPSEYSTTYSGPVEYSTDLFLGDPQVKKSQKSIFVFFQKCSKIGVNVEFCLKNTLNTPRGQFLPIFHHISQYKPLEKNNVFLRKSWFFAIFCDFWILMMRSIIRPEPAGNVKFGRKWVLWTPKILLHTLYVIIWWLEQIFFNSEKNSFFSFFCHILQMVRKMAKKWKKMIFSRFFKNLF